LTDLISTTEVIASIKSLPNGTAAGIDGIPYELFKALAARHAAAVKAEKPGFDVLNVLTEVFNDIEISGVQKGTAFNTGWMCPLYKKKD